MSDETIQEQSEFESDSYDLAGDTSHLYKTKSIDSAPHLVGKVVNSTERPKYCLGCGYDLRGILARDCPECGKYFNPNDFNTYACSSGDARKTKWKIQRPWFYPLLAVFIPMVFYFVLLSAILAIDPNTNPWLPVLEIVYIIAMLLSPIWHIAAFIVMFRCWAVRYNLLTRLLMMTATGALISCVLFMLGGFSVCSGVFALVTICFYFAATLISDAFAALWE